jgi:hypothetical protein
MGAYARLCSHFSGKRRIEYIYTQVDKPEKVCYYIVTRYIVGRYDEHRFP